MFLSVTKLLTRRPQLTTGLEVGHQNNASYRDYSNRTFPGTASLDGLIALKEKGTILMDLSLHFPPNSNNSRESGIWKAKK